MAVDARLSTCSLYMCSLVPRPIILWFVLTINYYTEVEDNMEH